MNSDHVLDARWEGDQYHISFADIEWFSTDGDEWFLADGTPVTGKVFDQARIMLNGGPRNRVMVA